LGLQDDYDIEEQKIFKSSVLQRIDGRKKIREAV